MKKKNHFFVNVALIILLVSSLIFLGTCLLNTSNLNYLVTLINALILILFTILFIIISMTSNRKNKNAIFICSVLLIVYFGFGILTNTGMIDIPSYKQMIDLTGKDLTYVVDWSTKNDIELNQVYEYSDLVEEYHVISQNVKVGTKLGKVKEVTLAISDGSNPFKEIIVANMVGWDCDQVLDYIEENHLTNIVVEFVESDKAANTLIEQSKSGTVKRNDEIKLTFSYGEELGFDQVKLIDFKNMSKFRVEFYLKQNHLRYEFLEDFSDKIKQGNAMKQEQAPGTMINVDDEKVKVTISKGPKVKVPELTNMTTKEVTEWIIKNKLKLSLKDDYDDKVAENKVIKANFKTGDIISRGTTVEIIISRGQLKMKEFADLNDFLEWANKYNIKYEQQYEFSDNVEAGKVIKYSHTNGQIIKNDDTIKVIISDGAKKKVPNLEGLTKSQIISKLNKLGLNYNFVYKTSNSVPSGKAIKQSISAGSEVSSGTTITITLSSGKPSTNNPVTEEKKPDDVKERCEEKTYTVSRKLLNVLNSYSGYDNVKREILAFFKKEYPGVTITVKAVDGGDASSGSYIGGVAPGDTIKTCGPTYEIKLAK